MADEEAKPVCHVCSMRDSVAPDDVVYSDENWTAIATGGVPGWVMLLLNRHSDEWLWGLNESEAGEYGVVLRRLTAAMRTALPAEGIYLVGFGENPLHFHHLLLSRTAETPVEWRGERIAGSRAGSCRNVESSGGRFANPVCSSC